MPTPAKAPTPEELTAFMAKHNLTYQQFADLMPTARVTVTKWMSGERIPAISLHRVLRDIERDLAALSGASEGGK